MVIDELLPLLQRLDQLLDRAVSEANIVYGDKAADDPYRGLHVEEEEVERSLSREPAIPLFPQAAAIPFPSDLVAPGSRLAWLQATFDLSNFDLDIAAIALAPELDRRYERLYAYLQDDVRCKQPRVDLVLNLLCPDAAAKLARRDRFDSDAPLIRHQLLHLVWDSSQPKPTLLTRNLQLDEQVVRFLLGETGLDSRLTSFCQLTQPSIAWEDLRLSESVKQALSFLCQESQPTQQPLRLYFQGSDRESKRLTAAAIASVMQVPLLQADLARIVATKADLEATVKRIIREAQFQNALLYIDSAEILQQEEQEIFYESLVAAIAQNNGITILAGIDPWHPRAASRLKFVMLTVPFSLPDFTQRRREWQDRLKITGISIPEADIDALSDRFRLNADGIADVVATASQNIRWKIATGEWQKISQIPAGDLRSILFAAARSQTGRQLAALSRKIEPKYGWEDIVLPADPQTQLREICNQAKYRHLVHEEWGFESKLSLGKGLNVLFSGPPGTGKTMAAEVIAGELQLDLYKIDLSQIVSKYIGETEKNLNRIFTAASNSNAILFFDEADALFGKRTEVKDAHDRYANIEVGYLLQKMEEYEGLAILTTNTRSNMDDAFVRRLRFIIEFPLPSEKQRRQIWEKILPDATPRSPDLDLDFLARQFEITGANIRNIALGAAFLAAANGNSVSMTHVIAALRREYQKMGKILMEPEFYRGDRTV